MRVSNTKITIRELNKLGDWRNAMLDLYKQGASDSEVRAMLREMRRDNRSTENVHRGFSVAAWNSLMKNSPAFASVVKEGQDAAKAWWETRAREAAIGNLKTNPANLIFALKNRAGYTDKQEVDHKGNDKPTFVVVQGKDAVSIEAPKPIATKATEKPQKQRTH